MPSTKRWNRSFSSVATKRPRLSFTVTGTRIDDTSAEARNIPFSGGCSARDTPARNTASPRAPAGTARHHRQGRMRASEDEGEAEPDLRERQPVAVVRAVAPPAAVAPVVDVDAVPSPVEPEGDLRGEKELQPAAKVTDEACGRRQGPAAGGVQSRLEPHRPDASGQERYQPAVAQPDLHVRLRRGHVHPADPGLPAEELPVPGDEVGAAAREEPLERPAGREPVRDPKTIRRGVVH